MDIFLYSFDNYKFLIESKHFIKIIKVSTDFDGFRRF